MEPPPADAHPSVSEDPEERVIQSLLRQRPPLHTRPLLDVGDDAAITDTGEVLTVDTLVEGAHFDARLSARDVAYKALAVSVSDLAATGARARWCLCALALSEQKFPWLEAFAQGLGEALAHFGVDLLGGDTVPIEGPTVISLTLGGRLVASPLTRSGAKPGDRLWVSGIPGLAGAGWQLHEPDPAALHALRHPEPPVAFTLALAKAGLASAAMDLSDGLGADVPRLAAASGVHITLDEAALPNHPALRQPRLHRFAGGDDYSLLFTAPPQHDAQITALAASFGVQISAIGTVQAGLGTSCVAGPWPSLAFRHFTHGTRP